MTAGGTNSGAGEPATAEPPPALDALPDYGTRTPTRESSDLLTVSEDDGWGSWHPWSPTFDGSTDGAGASATQGLTDPLAVPALDVALGV